MKKIKLFTILVLIFSCFCLALSGCSCKSCKEDVIPPDENPTEATITINKTETTIAVGGTETLTITGYEGDITWESSDTAIATVNAGVVTGVKEGTSYVTAKAGETELTCKVNVVEEATLVPTLVLDKKTTEMATGLTLTITPYIQNGLEFTKITTGVTWSSSDTAKATVDNGVVSGVAEGDVVITAKYTHEGKELVATVNLTVKSMNYHKAYVNGELNTLINPANVIAKDSYLGTTTASTENVIIKEVDIFTNTETDVTSSITWASTDSAVATANGGTITGGTKNGKCELIAKIGEEEVARVNVESWAEITTKAQMDKLALVTWTERANEDKVKEVLDGNYVLGGNINYNGEYILPIANTNPNLTIVGKGYPASLVTYASFIWPQILSQAEGKTVDVWKTEFKYNTAECTFNGINPLGLPFTGTFDGNGYKIQKAQILDVNHLYSQRPAPNDTTTAVFYAGGGCFIGTNEGTIKNINFEELYFKRYYGETTDREINMSGDYQMYYNHGNRLIPFRNSMSINNNFGLVRENKGTMSDIRIETYHRASYAHWDTTTQNSTNGGIAVCYNHETGLLNNIVILHKKGAMPQTAISGATYNIGSGFFSWTSRTIFNYNKGTIQNCFYFAEHKDGDSVINSSTGTSSNYSKSVLINYDSTSTMNTGTITNCNAYLATSGATCFENFTGTKTSYSSSLWDTTNFTMTAGLWDYTKV